MLRLLVKCHRRLTPQHDETTTLESWPDYVKRPTRTAEHHSTPTYLRRKWRWASCVAAQPLERWTQRAITWRQQFHDKRNPSRRQSRTFNGWEDDFFAFLQSIYSGTTGDTSPPPWQEIARNTNIWSQFEQQFINYTTEGHTSRATPTE